MDHGFYSRNTSNIRRAQVVDFTRATDAQWSVVVELLAGQAFAIPAGLRTDIFVLEGALVNSSGALTQVGGFLSLYEERALKGTAEGAVLLVYCEPAAAPRVPVSMLSHQPHSNSGGEELFVLSGELRVNGHDLPAGSWLRLDAGERHDSDAARATLILLRSGHLQ